MVTIDDKYLPKEGQDFPETLTAEMVGSGITAELVAVREVEVADFNNPNVKVSKLICDILIDGEKDPKGYWLNKTSTANLANKFGNNTDAWSHKKIKIFTAKVQTKSGLRDAIYSEPLE